ncbi:MAG: hypothetical protein K0S23_267 [Fluviicola sp.]|jgi:hypothetical protein|uniref:hypothetical protein n=1 Tax=Fluviicola sp. TaxID=1917219 RepID=UPI00262673D6|nr:hypothetical protein [Fluviicola sp.]MDF3025960.1 hypothetical protein [Fluviicola sp.]
MWLIITGLISLPSLIRSVSDILAKPFSLATLTIEIAYLTLISTFYFLIFQFMILKSHRTIDFLKLEKRFEHARIELAIPYSKSLKTIIILIGGILFLKAVPNLIEYIYSFSTEDLFFSQSQKTINMIVYSTQAVISFLIMTNSGIVQRYINKKSGETEQLRTPTDRSNSEFLIPKAELHSDNYQDVNA